MPCAKGWRPNRDPAAFYAFTIGKCVLFSEYEALRVRALQICMSPAQWLRVAALTSVSSGCKLTQAAIEN